MTKLVWDKATDRRFETGVDRGVLFPPTGSGVVWNGLISVDDSYDGGDVQAYYFDGIKYLDSVGNKTFKATISAFSAPVEFGPCVGEVPVKPGFILTGQPKVRFGLVYRSGISNTEYKIHLIYNATAKSTGKLYSTVGSNATPVPLSWEISAVPVASTTYKPSAHFIVDSRKVKAAALTSLENQLYGTATTAPSMPTVSALIALLK